MANLTFSYKGRNELILTREYNSVPPFAVNKDDVKFNDTSNPFSDYLASSSCGNWQDDKIKILSLPNKGRLFYLTNPGGGTAVYANVTIGQEIVVRDMTDNKVLKFSAEGSGDGQFTGNYFTEFTFERYCGTNTSNVVSVVKLNMIDSQIATPKIYVTNVVRSISEGTAVFTLHVEGATFAGYACGLMVNSSVNTGEKLSSTNVTIPGALIFPLKINANRPLGAEDRISRAVNIPVGVYPGCSILIEANDVPMEQYVYVSSGLKFSLDTLYENGIPASMVSTDLMREGIPE